jgi:hypothetical protein
MPLRIRGLPILEEGEEPMEWARLLAYITGTVDQELLLRNEYLAAESPSGHFTWQRRTLQFGAA